MVYEVVPPCEALKDLISHFWVGTWEETSRKPNSNYYVIASSLTELIFAFNNNHKEGDLLFSAVQGHTHIPGQFSVTPFRHLIGVSFYSYAIPRLFHIPAVALHKEFLSLDTFLGPEGNLLNEKIALAAGTQQRIQLLSDYFLSLIKKRGPEDQLIAAALQTIRKANGTVKIENLAAGFYLSQKQFSRRFKTFSGFNPKTYSRIIRFESLIKDYTNRTKLTDLAHAHDYYDQAHFIHECRSFTGFAPRDFWQLSEDSI